jgi:hypothetical protein
MISEREHEIEPRVTGMPRHSVASTHVMLNLAHQRGADRFADASAKVAVIRTSDTAATPTAPPVS